MCREAKTASLLFLSENKDMSCVNREGKCPLEKSGRLNQKNAKKLVEYRRVLEGIFIP